MTTWGAAPEAVQVKDMAAGQFLVSRGSSHLFTAYDADVVTSL